MVVERDHHGFDAPAPLGHPARAGLPAEIRVLMLWQQPHRESAVRFPVLGVI